MIIWALWRSPDYFWILDNGVIRFRSWCSLRWGVLVAVVSIDCSCGILKTCHGSLKKITMYWLRVIHNEFGPQACTDCNYCVLPGQYWALIKFTNVSCYVDTWWALALITWILLDFRRSDGSWGGRWLKCTERFIINREWPLVFRDIQRTSAIERRVSSTTTSLEARVQIDNHTLWRPGFEKTSRDYQRKFKWIHCQTQRQSSSTATFEFFQCNSSLVQCKQRTQLQSPDLGRELGPAD